MLRTADWVIAVLPDEQMDANVSFELGIAFALHKPILAFSPGILNLPTWVAHGKVVRARLSDREAIEFAVEGFLAPKARTPKKTTSPKTRLVDRDELRSLVNKVAELHKSPAPDSTKSIALSQIVQRLFEVSGLTSAAASDRSAPSAADLAVWIDDLDAQLGNPIHFRERNVAGASGCRRETADASSDDAPMR